MVKSPAAIELKVLRLSKGANGTKVRWTDGLGKLPFNTKFLTPVPFTMSRNRYDVPGLITVELSGGPRRSEPV